MRAALTQTKNAFPDMPASVADLGRLEGRLDEIRRVNIAHHLELMAVAREHGAGVICFGELFAAPFFPLNKHAVWFALAEDALAGPTATELCAVARKMEMIVVAPLFEHDARSGKYFNTAIVIAETGQILGTYRKTHIPNGRNEQNEFVEAFYFERSDGKNHVRAANVSNNPYFPVYQTSVGRIGVASCYDRHFEGVISTLASEGAQLIFSPAVTFGAKSRRMWHLEFPVDAARHNVFIGGSNRCGVEAPWNQPFFGDSYFVGPNGVLANLSSQADLVIAEIDLDELSRPDPSGWNLSRDIRHDIYSPRGTRRKV